MKPFSPGLLFCEIYWRPTSARELPEAGLSATATTSDITFNRLHRGQEFPTVFKWSNYLLWYSSVSQSACRGAGEAAGCLGVVTRRHQQVCEHEQLVVGEALPMLLPVIVVSAPELRQGLLHRHLGRKKHNNHDTMEKYILLCTNDKRTSMPSLHRLYKTPNIDVSQIQNAVITHF